MENTLDQVDIGILKLLEADGGMSHKEIAYLLHKSVTPIHARIKRLKKDGYIKRITALVDHKKVDRSLIVYTQVRVKAHNQENLEIFMKAAAELPEVMECYHMSGSFDFLLRIAIRDMDEYHLMLIKKLSNLPNIGNIESLFVMAEAKHETGYMFGVK